MDEQERDEQGRFAGSGGGVVGDKSAKKPAKLEKLSSDADRATQFNREKPTPAGNRAARDAHLLAAERHSDAGNHEKASYHEKKAEIHDRAARQMQAKEDHERGMVTRRIKLTEWANKKTK